MAGQATTCNPRFESYPQWKTHTTNKSMVVNKTSPSVHWVKFGDMSVSQTQYHQWTSRNILVFVTDIKVFPWPHPKMFFTETSLGASKRSLYALQLRFLGSGAATSGEGWQVHSWPIGWVESLAIFEQLPSLYGIPCWGKSLRVSAGNRIGQVQRMGINKCPIMVNSWINDMLTSCCSGSELLYKWSCT